MADEKKLSHADELRERLIRKSLVVKAVLATPEGKEFFEVLRSEFFRELKGKTDIEIAMNAGRADVIAYIMQLASLNSEGR